LRFWGYFTLFYLFFVLRSTPITGQGYYMVIDVLPFMAVGLAAALLKGGKLAFTLFQSEADVLLDRLSRLVPARFRTGSLLRTYARTLLASVPVVLIFVLPVVGTLLDSLYSMTWGFLDQPLGLTASVGDAESVIAYINAQIQPTDVVLASPQIGWAIHGSAADFQQSAAYEHQKTIHFPTNVPHERFIFDPSLSNAKYVIVDNLWRDWAAEKIPAVKDMVEQVQHWPIAMELGEYRVYRNPQK
jgi:hypothetical protein